MKRLSRFASRTAAAAAAVVLLNSAQAIEAPKTQPPAPPESPQAPPVEITPTDETAFYEKLRRVTHYRELRGLRVPAQVLDQLAKGNADLAVASLGAAASQGSQDANIALVHVQHWCSGLFSSKPGDPQAQLAKLGNELPQPRAARAAGVIRAEAEFRNRARAACGKAQFDYRAIEDRLRAAADAGHPASAAELAQFVRDPAKRQALLETAADKNYAPAQYAMATNLLVAVQRGETTQNVGSIRELLKKAGRSIPKAKLDLANCMALGCDGHPADTLSAQAWGIDAARDGEPTAFLSMVRMPWGGRLSRTQLLAWQYFGDRLNESGCMGDAYVRTAIGFAQTIQLLEKRQDAKAIETAKSQYENLWRDHGGRAMKENGCAQTASSSQPGEQRVSVRSVDFELLAQRQGDVVLGGAESNDVGPAARLLRAELSAILRSDSIDQQNGPVHAGDASLGARRQIRAAHRPLAIAQPHPAGAVAKTLVQHDDLADVAVTGAMARERAVQLTLAQPVLAPEIQAEHRTGEDYEPGHGAIRSRQGCTA